MLTVKFLQNILDSKLTGFILFEINVSVLVDVIWGSTNILRYC